MLFCSETVSSCCAFKIRCTLSYFVERVFFKEGNMTDGKKVVWAREQLISKQTELGRLPQKSDFDEVTRSRIKAFLGPWPRALESAGLKQKKN